MGEERTGLLELGAFEILLQLEAGEGLGLASVLLKVLSVPGLLALPELQGKLQLQGGGQGRQHPWIQLIHIIRQHCLHTSCPLTIMDSIKQNDKEILLLLLSLLLLLLLLVI